MSVKPFTEHETSTVLSSVNLINEKIILCRVPLMTTNILTMLGWVVLFVLKIYALSERKEFHIKYVNKTNKYEVLNVGPKSKNSFIKLNAYNDQSKPSKFL